MLCLLTLKSFRHRFYINSWGGHMIQGHTKVNNTQWGLNVLWEGDQLFGRLNIGKDV